MQHTNETSADVVRFEPGRRYACRSACDHNCVWTFEVVRRTAKSVWIREADGGDRGTKRRKVDVYEGRETVFPLGTFSMAPILSADRPEANR